jgi:hypothetical protein
VSEDHRAHQPPRARPAVDLPAEALAARADELARRWAIALILQRPLDVIGEIPLESLAREAPELCARAVRALRSDDDLERLTGRGGGLPAPARRLAAMSGARDPVEAAEAAEALRGVLWEGLLEVVEEPSPRQLGDAGDRLAQVCAAGLAAALEAMTGAGGVSDDAPALAAAAIGDRPHSPCRPADGVGGGRAVIVDERAGGGTPSSRGAARWREQRRASVAAPPRRAAEIEIRDQRREGGAAAWIGSIGTRLDRFAQDGIPFAVLLIEVIGLERLRAREPSELDRVGAALQEVLAAELAAHADGSGGPAAHGRPGARPAGSLTRERAGRFWLVAANADRADARLLGERIESVAGAIRTARGRPLAVAVGTASCPQDGREAAALAAHADVGLYAARAAARRSAAAEEPA